MQVTYLKFNAKWMDPFIDSFVGLLNIAIEYIATIYLYWIKFIIAIG